MPHKFLPVGIQNFEKMITGDFLYVDKTRYLYEIARPIQGFYSLARPRRYGKSLMVSTLARALFRQNGSLLRTPDRQYRPEPAAPPGDRNRLQHYMARDGSKK